MGREDAPANCGALSSEVHISNGLVLAAAWHLLTTPKSNFRQDWTHFWNAPS